VYNPLLDACPLKARPGQILGYRTDGRPIYPIAGGSEPVVTPPAVPAAPASPAAPAPTPPAPPAPPAAPTPPAAPKLEDLLASLDETARKAVLDEVSRARGDAARYRTERQTATTQAQEAQAQRDAVLKALGIKADGSADVDPAQVAEQAQNDAWVAKVSLAIYQSAGRLGADAAKLLDSVTFIDSLDQHVTVQPGDPNFAAQVDAAITSAVTANAAYKTATPVPPASGAPMPGTPGEGPKRATSLGAAVSAALRPRS